jgi:hypothetical protein
MMIDYTGYGFAQCSSRSRAFFEIRYTMSAERYFAYAAEVMKLQPPHVTDQPIIARLKSIGFELGKSFDLERLIPS